LTATIGRCLATSGASRANVRGLPKLSMYSAITLVRGSPCQYASRSLTETSALLPIEAKSAIPSWSWFA
jgi:hypothetical protein